MASTIMQQASMAPNLKHAANSFYYCCGNKEKRNKEKEETKQTLYKKKGNLMLQNEIKTLDWRRVMTISPVT